ncbi:undecaprenyl-diphosphate phosphatase [Candidatus Dojkabacteria bacterium]|uniref:Undecaprenyl-diphosphatase n=1 Tax=Candidatus Dojkabacteria bacterium TaxID=2099670 RepID=A0A955L1H2_9BACT|nr:undecaprenyl-diphosphate phosphatase [Candidatus Dojkabacteria bacterium]
MNLIQILLLAVLQGLTEFIPVSSSGHLVIASNFLSSNVSAEDINSVIIFLHFGTLFAVIFHYRNFIFEILLGLVKREEKYLLIARNIILTSIPVFIVGLGFTLFIEKNLSREVQFYIATAALITAGTLFIFSERFILNSRERTLKSEDLSIYKSLMIGVFQSIGVIYGVSRSGITLFGSRSLSMTNKDSLDYTFLASIPVLVGASLVTLLTELDSAVQAVSIENIIIGIVVSGITGYFAISFLLRYMRKRGLRLFGFYCVGFGIISLLLSFVI